MPAFPSLERRIPLENHPHIHKFSISDHQFYLKVQHYGTGEIGSIGIQAVKEGAAVNGLLDGLSKTTSLGLQYGVPLENLVQEWKGSRFEPSGFTNNRHIPHVKSLADYAATYLEHYQVVFPYQQQPGLVRQTLPESAAAMTHKFSIDGREGFLSFWFYPRESAEPTTVGRIKFCWAKEGSPIYGIMDTLGTTASTALQYGVPLSALLEEWKGLSFPPSGMTQESQQASSVLDYAANFLIKRLELEK